MNTKRIWQPQIQEKRQRRRVSADFYAVEVVEGGRYLRRVANISDAGLLMESPLADERPGEMVELELPRRRGERPLRVHAEVVRVTRDGRVGVRVKSAPLPVDTLGGPEAL